jgi:hypothetical protein
LDVLEAENTKLRRVLSDLMIEKLEPNGAEPAE